MRMATSLYSSAAAAARRRGAATLLSVSAGAGAAPPARRPAATLSLPWPSWGRGGGGDGCDVATAAAARCSLATSSVLRHAAAPHSVCASGRPVRVAGAARCAAAAAAAGPSLVVAATQCRAAAAAGGGEAAAAAAVAAPATVRRGTRFVRAGERGFCSSSSSSAGAAAAAGQGHPRQQEREQQEEEGGHQSSLEGRYATALLRAAKKQNQLEAVYGEMTNLKELLQQSEDFKRFVETPALSSPQKQALLQQLCATYKLQPLTSNLLQTLLENRRLPVLGRVAEAFEVLYRREKGEVKCVVTSAQPLTSQQQKEVVAALQKRAGPRATLILEYVVNPQLMGGLVVRLGERVLDFSVATRIERLQAQLMAPF